MSDFKFSRRALLKGAALSAGALSLPSVSYAKPYLITGKANNIIYGPAKGVAKLNANENPYGPSPSALKAMEEAIKQGSYYVSMVPRLKAMIAERNNVTPEHILILSLIHI